MFDGLNLGLAINIADGASVNAARISSSIEKLLALSKQLGQESKQTGKGVDGLADSFNHSNRSAVASSGGIRSFGTSLERLEPRLISVRSGIIRLFPYVSVLGGVYALKRGFDDMMNTFSDYEYAMKNMQAATGYNTGEMNMLDRQFRELAVSGRFTAKEIAEAGYDLTTTIEIEADKVKDLTQSVLSYATATQYSVKESGLDMLSLLSKLNRPLGDSTILFDQMAKATNITSLTAQRLSEMLKITGTEALGMKVPFDQLLALMGRTDLYYKGGEGGTRLRMMFQMLAQSTKIHGDILTKYGLTMDDVDIKSQGLLKVLSKLKGMEYGDLSRLVGGYSAGLVMRLSQDTKYIAEMQAKLTEAASKGTTVTMYDVQIHSLDGRRKQLKNIVTEMELTMADAAKQPYASFLGNIAGYVTEITIKMKQNSGVLSTIFHTIFGWVNQIGDTIGRGIKNILGWTGLLADTQEESQRLMRNNLLPFLVFVEVMGIRVWNFIKGFASGFEDGAKLVWKAVSSIGGWISDLIGWILPLSGQFNSLGYVLGFAVPLLWGLGKAAAVLRMILPALGVEVQGVSIWTALWNTVLLANPLLLIGAAVIAVMLVIHKHRAQIQDWIDTLPDWQQAIASTFTLGFLNDDKYVSRWEKLWNSITGVVMKGVYWVASQIDSLLSLLPKSVKVFLGIENEGVEAKLRKFNNQLTYGSDHTPTPEGESVIQHENKKSEELAKSGVMLTDKNTIGQGTIAGMQNKTFNLYANFGKTDDKAKKPEPSNVTFPLVGKKDTPTFNVLYPPATKVAAEVKTPTVTTPITVSTENKVQLSPMIKVETPEAKEKVQKPSVTDVASKVGDKKDFVKKPAVSNVQKPSVTNAATKADDKAKETKRVLPPATTVASKVGGSIGIKGVANVPSRPLPPAVTAASLVGLKPSVPQVVRPSLEASKVLTPEEMEQSGVSEDMMSEYQDDASEMMQGYKSTADQLMKNMVNSREARKPQAPIATPQTIHQEFKFGDINIDAKGGDPEKIARELVPYIRKVVREEMNR